MSHIFKTIPMGFFGDIISQAGGALGLATGGMTSVLQAGAKSHWGTTPGGILDNPMLNHVIPEPVRWKFVKPLTNNIPTDYWAHVDAGDVKDLSSIPVRPEVSLLDSMGKVLDISTPSKKSNLLLIVGIALVSLFLLPKLFSSRR